MAQKNVFLMIIIKLIVSVLCVPWRCNPINLNSVVKGETLIAWWIDRKQAHSMILFTQLLPMYMYTNNPTNSLLTSHSK